MTQTNAGGAAKDAADQNFDYMFKLLIIGNSSVGKTSFVCFFLFEIIFFKNIYFC
jgi:hypothetical protein